MNIKCKSCSHARNCINGKWCELKKKYVEHIDKLLCDEN